MADWLNASEYTNAVEIRNCSKGYEIAEHWFRRATKRRVVFDCVNLSVPLRATYALLGPSGCGKTTLLKCIMGRLRVDNGTVEIFGHQLELSETVNVNDIGYMPQETSLFALLTIEQTLQYYGKILGLSNAYVKSQTKYFVEFLKLPPKGTINNKLSGGQLRRLSFAVAIMHRPKLLILDEPTVGVDPIGIQRMWCCLRYLQKHYSTSIILTTHYLEEARSANLIGLMHNGSMAAEGSPRHLMDTWHVETLEELFYEICSKQVSNKTTPKVIDILCNQSESQCGANETLKEQLEQCDAKLLSKASCFPSTDIEKTQGSGCFRINRLIAIIKKNAIQFYRLPFGVVFLLLLPSVQLGITTIAMTGEIFDLNVGVYNADQGKYGDMYLQVLDAKFIRQVPYFSYSDGQLDVLNHKLLGLIYIERNFSAIFGERFVEFETLKRNLSHGGNLNFTIDPTDLMLSHTLLFHLITKFTELTRRAILDAGLSPQLANHHLKFQFQPKELIGKAPLETAAPYEFILVIYITQLATSMLLMFLEKACGYLERSIVAGVKVWEMVISYIIFQYVICWMQVSIMVITCIGILKVTLIGSIMPAIFLANLAGLVGMTTGLLLAAACHNLIIIGTLTLSVAIAATPLAGMILPVGAMPPFFQYLCMFLPLHLPGEAMADLMYRDLGLLHPDVVVGIAVMLAWIIGQTLLTIFFLRKHIK